jgi:hypothetical protein
MSLHETVTGLALVDNHAHAIEPPSSAGFKEMFPGIFTEGALDTRDARHTLNYWAPCSGSWLTGSAPTGMRKPSCSHVAPRSTTPSTSTTLRTL